ncbi:uncharacterized protein A4U43_C05F32130 [Asparagus officinalis]|uniref:Uncharacterized protein n=1 Tax=Asparagus officinalis TaxID=4686 RepID=A0A5P1EWJ4_ASPOF|nr:uncharacterized protein A4U43_C05F32130 [Asparagus officinalis]
MKRPSCAPRRIDRRFPKGSSVPEQGRGGPVTLPPAAGVRAPASGEALVLEILKRADAKRWRARRALSGGGARMHARTRGSWRGGAATRTGQPRLRRPTAAGRGCCAPRRASAAALPSTPARLLQLATCQARGHSRPCRVRRKRAPRCRGGEVGHRTERASCRWRRLSIGVLYATVNFAQRLRRDRDRDWERDRLDLVS